MVLPPILIILRLLTTTRSTERTKSSKPTTARDTFLVEVKGETSILPEAIIEGVFVGEGVGERVGFKVGVGVVTTAAILGFGVEGAVVAASFALATGIEAVPPAGAPKN